MTKLGFSNENMKTLLGKLGRGFAVGMLCVGASACNPTQPARKEQAQANHQLFDPVEESRGPHAGRYRIVSGMFTSGSTTEHLIIKLDTATGESWKYQTAGISTGLPDKSTVLAEGWLEIPDSFSQSVTEAQATAGKFKSREYTVGK